MGIFISNILAGFFIVGSAFFVVWLVYYMQFHFTSVRTLPSMATLPTRAVVGILLSAIPVFVSVFLLLKFDTEIQQFLFDSNTTTFFVSGLYIVLFLWISWICFVFRCEKRIWKHQNPKHCRLVLQTINKSTKVEGIAIRSIDGIKNGRGVGFSWFNGYLVAAGIHEIEFEFYTYRKFHSHSMKDPIYTKNITMDFLPDAVYNVEARAGCRKFRISRVMGWNR
ncbi:hypothetical protein O3689_06375 [Prevotella nigrescens]|uniref:hypothetical protein n=1 Tax=Prevotella nigrescens TaxID=28133 RepID=UPI0028E6C029|nr:hypothetical protein [Prevotella nigrescens]